MKSTKPSRHNRKPILFAIVHLPPPYHGASAVGKQFIDSKVINSAFTMHYRSLTISSSIVTRGIQSFAQKIFRSMYLQAKLIIEIVRIRPDLIYITANASGLAFWKDFLILVPIKLLRIPHALHFHNKGFERLEKMLFGKIILKLFFLNSRAIFLSQRLLSDLPTLRHTIRYSVCWNGAPPPSMPVSIIRNSNICIILFVSNLLREKGVFDLIRACVILDKEGIEFICNIIGAPGDISPQELHESITNSRVGHRMKYLGPLYGIDKEEHFRNSDIFVFPTYYRKECFPLVLLEAMSFGLPIVSTFEGAIPDIVVDGKNGYLCHQQDPVGLANRIRELLLNPSLRTKFGEEAMSIYLEKFTSIKFERNMTNCLLEILSDSSCFQQIR